MEEPRPAEINRRTWNAAALLHRRERLPALTERFSHPGSSLLDDVLTAFLRERGLAGRRVAQPCCNDGREVISVANLGAARAVGFDISDEFIAIARSLAHQSGVAAQFHRADALDLPDTFHAQFDLVLVTAGSLCWFDDLDAFLVSCAALLRDGGELVVHETHPYTELLSTPEEQEFDPARPYHAHRSYFADVAWEEEPRMAYGDPAFRNELSFISYPHTLSDIFHGTISAGIRITDFREYPHDISSSFSHIQEDGRVPLSFLLHGVR